MKSSNTAYKQYLQRMDHKLYIGIYRYNNRGHKDIKKRCTQVRLNKFIHKCFDWNLEQEAYTDTA